MTPPSRTIPATGPVLGGNGAAVHPSGTVAGPVSHLTRKEVEELRQRLINRRRCLLREIARLQNEAYRTGGLGETARASNRSSGQADGPDDQWELLLRLSSIAHKRSLLNEVEQALERIKKKTYGFCLATNKAISVSRLREIPWARHS